MDLSRFVRQHSKMNASIAKAVDIMRFGSYSDRHPALGKMRKCQDCGRRSREFGEKCCNATIAKEVPLFGQRFKKQVAHRKGL